MLKPYDLNFLLTTLFKMIFRLIKFINLYNFFIYFQDEKFMKSDYFDRVVFDHLEQMSASFSLKEMSKCVHYNQKIGSKHFCCNQQILIFAFYYLHSKNSPIGFLKYFNFFEFHKYLMN